MTQGLQKGKKKKDYDTGFRPCYFAKGEQKKIMTHGLGPCCFAKGEERKKIMTQGLLCKRGGRKKL